jgi:hypothetical protein
MKRIAVVALVSMVLGSVSYVSNAANPSAGANCSRLGLTQISKGKKFTCVKSGKKLIWNKGIAVAPTPTSTPTPTPTPTSTPTPTPTPTSTPTSTPTPQNESLVNFENISRESYRLIRLNWPVGNTNLKIEYHYTKNFPVDFIAPWKAQVERSAAYYEKFIDTPQTFHIYFVTELDEDWMYKEGMWNAQNIPTFFKWWNQGLDTNNCEGAAAWHLQGRNGLPPALYGGIAISSKSLRGSMIPWCEHVISHEMFHAVQDYWFHLKLGAIGFDSQNTYDNLEMPIFREGSADTIATALGQPTYESYFAAFSNRFSLLLKGDAPKLGSIKSKEELVKYLKDSELRSNHAEAHNASYFLGMMVFEYAIAKYGLDKYSNLLMAQNRNTQFREAFKKAYGFEIDQLYLEAAPHVLDAIKILTT